MKARNYQKEGIRFLKSARRCLLKAPAGSGKTFIANAALKLCLQSRKSKTLANVEIMVHTVEQLEQMLSMSQQLEVDKLCNLLVFCAASADLTTRPDLLIVDECHHAAADTWRAKIESCDCARWGLSATPFDKQREDRNAIIRDLFSDRFLEIERDELVANGHLAQARVEFYSIDCDSKRAEIDEFAVFLEKQRRQRYPFLFANEDSEREQVNRCKWQAAQSRGIFENEKRDASIIARANRRIADGCHVIVLIGKIEHGERLQKQIVESRLVFSKMGKKRRAEAISDFRSGKQRCLIATSMLDEGFDAPIADCLIVASAGRSHRKAVQSTGRVLRSFDGKDHGVIIDFTDDFNPMLARQSKTRASIYRKLKYSIKIFA